MKIALLYPPISNIRYPYLSLPSLAAFLKKAGHRPVSKDANLEGGTEIDCHPERFGITKVHRGDRVSHGLRYGYRFETRSGMEMKEAAQMGEYITGKVREATLDRLQ